MSFSFHHYVGGQDGQQSDFTWGPATEALRYKTIAWFEISIP